MLLEYFNIFGLFFSGNIVNQEPSQVCFKNCHIHFRKMFSLVQMCFFSVEIMISLYMYNKIGWVFLTNFCYILTLGL